MDIFSLLVAFYLYNQEAYKQQLLINYIVKSAEIHGVDSFVALSLVSCESRFKEDATGDWRSEDQIYLSHGLFQFQKPTFYHYAKIYGIKGEWKNPFVQTDLAILMLRDGLWYKWYNCYKAIRNS